MPGPAAEGTGSTDEYAGRARDARVLRSTTMGMVRCELHGLQPMWLTSAAVARAVRDGERWSRGDLVRVRVELWDDQEPRGRLWLDRATFGDLDDKPVSLMLANDGACAPCMQAWLEAQGIDDPLSTEEQRFLGISTALDDVMRPLLEPCFAAMLTGLCHQWDGPAGFGFRPTRGRPFVASVTSARGVELRVEVCEIREPGAAGDVRGPGSRLIAGVDVAPAGVVVPEPLEVALVDDELDGRGSEALAAWAQDVVDALGSRGGDT